MQSGLHGVQAGSGGPAKRLRSSSVVSEGERRQLTLTETAAKKANKQGAPTEQEVGRAHIGDGNCKPVPTTTRASFVTYNTEGLSRLHEPDVRAYLADLDFCW